VLCLLALVADEGSDHRGWVAEQGDGWLQGARCAGAALLARSEARVLLEGNRASGSGATMRGEAHASASLGPIFPRVELRLRSFRVTCRDLG